MPKHPKEMPSPVDLGLPLTGADSHAHLVGPKLWPDFEAVLERATRAGVQTIGQIFLNHTQYAEKIEIMARHPQLYFTLGIHPSDGEKLGEEEALIQEEILRQDDRIRAVGEIGLDFYHNTTAAPFQEKLFRSQLRLAKTLDRPVVIHCRDAFPETLAILDEEGYAGARLLWHCFGGDTAMAQELLRRGWHISIPGPITYPANSALREAVRSIPAERLMVETDCPYLAPQEWRGKVNEPALCAFTALAVAREKGMDPAELWTLCGNNTRAFFGV